MGGVAPMRRHMYLTQSAVLLFLLLWSLHFQKGDYAGCQKLGFSWLTFMRKEIRFSNRIMWVLSAIFQTPTLFDLTPCQKSDFSCTKAIIRLSLGAWKRTEGVAEWQRGGQSWGGNILMAEPDLTQHLLEVIWRLSMKALLGQHKFYYDVLVWPGFTRPCRELLGVSKISLFHVAGWIK